MEILLKEGLHHVFISTLASRVPDKGCLVNELCKHRQLQPPSLCTLAKAHLAKILLCFNNIIASYLGNNNSYDHGDADDAMVWFILKEKALFVVKSRGGEATSRYTSD